MDLLLSGFGFILLLGTLIFVHEMGHFIVAKLCGVRVLTFSIGFVGKIFSFRYGETEYRVGWLPLGGYVQMFGDLGQTISEEDRPVAFTHKPLWQRSLIILAGPLANLVFLPILAFFVLHLQEKEALSSTIGSVSQGKPAWKAGLLEGDVIVSVDGKKVRYFSDLVEGMGQKKPKELSIVVTRDGKKITKTIRPVLIEMQGFLGAKKQRSIIGITPHFLRSEVGVPDPSSPAYLAGMRTFDQVVAVDGKPIHRWSEMAGIRKQNPQKSYEYQVKRWMSYQKAGFGFSFRSKKMVFRIQPQARKHQGKIIYWDGIETSEGFIESIIPNSPFAKAKLLAGDKILQIDGKNVHSYADLTTLPRKKDKRYTIQFLRKGQKKQVSFELFETTWVDSLNQKHKELILGAHFRFPFQKGVMVPIENKVSFAFERACRETWMVVGMMTQVFQKLFTRELGTEQLGGPIMIFQVTQQAVESGWNVFVRQLAFISINLGLVNLFPIPVLDGGHLLLFLIEAIIRRPIPDRFKEIVLLIGFVFLLLLMLIAFKNDIQRAFFQ